MQFTAQTATHWWILFITASINDHDEEKRTEVNLIVCSSKSEANLLITEDCTPRFVVLTLITARHEAFHCLSATAELLEIGGDLSSIGAVGPKYFIFVTMWILLYLVYLWRCEINKNYYK